MSSSDGKIQTVSIIQESDKSNNPIITVSSASSEIKSSEALSTSSSSMPKPIVSNDGVTQSSSAEFQESTPEIAENISRIRKNGSSVSFDNNGGIINSSASSVQGQAKKKNFSILDESIPEEEELGHTSKIPTKSFSINYNVIGGGLNGNSKYANSNAASGLMLVDVEEMEILAQLKAQNLPALDPVLESIKSTNCSEDDEDIEDKELFEELLANMQIVGKQAANFREGIKEPWKTTDCEPFHSNSLSESFDIENPKNLTSTPSAVPKIQMPESGSNSIESRNSKIANFFNSISLVAIILFLTLILGAVGVTPLILSRLVASNGTPLYYALEFSSIFLLVIFFSVLVSYVLLEFIKILYEKYSSMLEESRFLELLSRVQLPLSFGLGAIMVTITYRFLFEYYCPYMREATSCWDAIENGTRVLACLTVSVFLLVIEKYLHQLIIMKFHSIAYETRIIENRLACYIISQLKHLEVYKASEEMRRSSSVPSANRNSLKDYLSWRRKKADEGIIKSDIMPLQECSTEKSRSVADGFDAFSKLLKFETLRSFTAHLKKSSTKKKANQLAGLRGIIRKTRVTCDEIFNNLVGKRKNFITFDDFKKYFDTEDGAKRAFSFFDINKQGKLKRKQVKRAILQTYIDKHHISKSLMDMQDALHVLDRILLVLCGVIVFFVWLGIFNVSFQTTLSMVVSLTAASVFFVGDGAKSLFASIVFLLIQHPYDVGDRVEINNETLIVHKLHLLQTIFRKPNNQEVYITNSSLANERILNVRRSGDTSAQYIVQMDFNTIPDKIQIFKAKLTEFVAKCPDDFYPDPFFLLAGFDTSQTILYEIYIQHRSNFHNSSLKNQRNIKIYSCIIYLLKYLNIQHKPPSLLEVEKRLPQESTAGNTNSGLSSEVSTNDQKNNELSLPPRLSYCPSFKY